MSPVTIDMAEAKTNFSRITANANITRTPITVFKNNKPWVEIRPLAANAENSDIPPEMQEALLESEAIKSDPDHERFVDANSFFKSLGI